MLHIYLDVVKCNNLILLDVGLGLFVFVLLPGCDLSRHVLVFKLVLVLGGYQQWSVADFLLFAGRAIRWLLLSIDLADASAMEFVQARAVDTIDSASRRGWHVLFVTASALTVVHASDSTSGIGRLYHVAHIGACHEHVRSSGILLIVFAFNHFHELLVLRAGQNHAVALAARHIELLQNVGERHGGVSYLADLAKLLSYYGLINVMIVFVFNIAHLSWNNGLITFSSLFIIQRRSTDSSILRSSLLRLRESMDSCFLI